MHHFQMRLNLISSDPTIALPRVNEWQINLSRALQIQTICRGLCMPYVDSHDYKKNHVSFVFFKSSWLQLQIL